VKLKRILNLKDISYLNGTKDFALVGFKFESPYFDGSTTGSLIINLPEENLIKMSLISNGFEVEKSITSLASKNLNFFTKSHGELSGFIVATKTSSVLNSRGKYLKDRTEYERRFLFAHPKIKVINLWLGKTGVVKQIFTGVNFSPPRELSLSNRLLFAASRQPNKLFARFVFRQSKLDFYEKSILQNISKAPVFKVGFELAKHLLVNGQLDEAKDLLTKLTKAQNCDWRVFYRSCYFSACIAEIENDSISCGHYLNLLKIANPLFPITNIAGTN